MLGRGVAVTSDWTAHLCLLPASRLAEPQLEMASAPQVRNDPEGFVAIKVLTTFNKMKKLSKNIRVVAEALRTSKKLVRAAGLAHPTRPPILPAAAPKP